MPCFETSSLFFKLRKQSYLLNNIAKMYDRPNVPNKIERGRKKKEAFCRSKSINTISIILYFFSGCSISLIFFYFFSFFVYFVISLRIIFLTLSLFRSFLFYFYSFFFCFLISMKHFGFATDVVWTISLLIASFCHKIFFLRLRYLANITIFV